MVHPAALAGFALVAPGLVLTPGPNMMDLVSRAVCQSRAAGFISLAGIGVGFFVAEEGMPSTPLALRDGSPPAAGSQ